MGRWGGEDGGDGEDGEMGRWGDGGRVRIGENKPKMRHWHRRRAPLAKPNAPSPRSEMTLGLYTSYEIY